MAKRKCANEPVAQCSGTIIEESIQYQVSTERMLGFIISCKEGHSVCTACHDKFVVPKKCPQCGVRFPVSRNRTLEDVVSKHTFACEHGCGKVALPAKLLAHQLQCDRAPVECPECGQCVQPADLKHHFKGKHFNTTDRSHVLAEQSGAKFKTSSMYHFNAPVVDNFEVLNLFDGPGKQSASMKTHLLQCGTWHIRVFHFTKEMKFVMSLGEHSDVTFSAKTESVRGLKSWDEGDASAKMRFRHIG